MFMSLVKLYLRASKNVVKENDLIGLISSNISDYSENPLNLLEFLCRNFSEQLINFDLISLNYVRKSVLSILSF